MKIYVDKKSLQALFGRKNKVKIIKSEEEKTIGK